MHDEPEGLIPKHGGYENTVTWKIADLIYDITVLFCDKYVDRRDRTHDQMVQAARSGCQNLQEGSVDSAVSKKIELKLTGIARGSLLELQRDFKKHLQHRNFPEWPPEHPALLRFKARRCVNLTEFRRWVAAETKLYTTATDHPIPPTDFPRVCAANGALSLLNLCTYHIKRQMNTQAKDFEENGGFTERLYKIRQQKRRTQ